MKFKDLLPILTGINRIRLEFKVKPAQKRKRVAGGINRIRLEFKPVQTLKHSAQRRVLIESDWNLKDP